MEDALLLVAAASGLAVVCVAWLSGRLGGTLGGLLATAPATTTAALLYLAHDAGNDAAATAALDGGRALAAALVGMPLYAWTTARAPLRPGLRMALGMGLFLAVFTVGTLLLARLPWPPASWILVDLALAAGLSLLPWPEASAQEAAPGAAPRRYEVPLRFLAGAAVVLVVGLLRGASPDLASAWAVFPGTFVVSLLVLGRERGAGWSAHAARGGILGAPALAAYLVTLHLLLPWSGHAAWAWLVQVPAWLAYFACVPALWRRRATPEPGRATT